MNPGPPIIQLFRKTEIWNTLNQTLEEMTEKFSIPAEVTNKINERFDQVIANELEKSNMTNKTSIKANLDTYNNTDSIWIFSLSGVQIKTENESLACDRMKILACDKSQLEDGKKKKADSKKRQSKKKK
mmetsp:Transcript_58497/g.67558  ORF Transcript_58497/g.67558 Transcript_58497/m.67558 type:complete len:129 (-) Transcript_58497:72-458(-)